MKNKTQNILKKYLFFALGMLAAAILPTMAFAVTPPSTSALIGYNPFEVPSTDLSVAFLSQIFGNIPGALSVATETIFGQIFYIFNSAMLIVAGVILTYGTLKFIIELSQHHDQMQRKYNYWQPLRVVLGFGFLAPLPSGYSALNILIMWTFIQGIGLADSVWTQAVDYMNKGGILTIAAYQGTKSPIAEAPTLIAMEAIQHTKGSGTVNGMYVLYAICFRRPTT
jgi:defect-in-organelle-trafficking protein DotA